MTRSITAPKQYKSAGASLRGRVSFDGILDSTNYGHLQTDVISSSSVNGGALTISSVQASTAAMTISGTTVSAGRAVLFRVSGGVVGVTYRIKVTIGTTLADIAEGICPLRIVAST